MAINIQEQFEVNISLPIDRRLVADGTATRDSIAYKYDGMLVFDTVDRKTYVWNEVGSTYSLTDISGVGQNGYIPKWSSVSGLTSSPIVISNVSSNTLGKVGINTESTTIREVFQINSANTSSQPFVVHKGAANNILASNWYSDSGNDNYFDYASGSGAIKFKSDGQIWILTRGSSDIAMNTSDSINTNIIAIIENTQANFLKQIHFSSNGTSGTGSAAFIKSTNGYSTSTSPDYTWRYNDQTGIYHPSFNKIGMSIAGSQKFILDSTGLLLSSNNSISSPSSKLHIDNGSGSSYIQFTAGPTTGTGTNTGFMLGINTGGYPTFQSRHNNSAYLFIFSNGNNYYKMDRNELTMYSNSVGEVLSSVINGGGYRTIYGTKSKFQPSTGTMEIGSITVPNSCYVSIEAVFTSSLPTSPRQFRTNKRVASYAVNSSGVISAQNSTDPGFTSTTSGISLYMLRSSSASAISAGSFDVSTVNTIKFTQGFILSSGHSTVAFTAVINTGVGQI
jgi:hypothetical protein